MVDEEESGIVRREPFLVSFRFHIVLFGLLRRSNGTAIPLIYLQGR